MSKSCSASAVKAIINTGQVRLYDSAISGMKKEGILRRCYRHRAGPILEQHPGAGSSSDQTTSEGQAGLSWIPRGAANDPRIRGHAHDPEGAGDIGTFRLTSISMRSPLQKSGSIASPLTVIIRRSEAASATLPAATGVGTNVIGTASRPLWTLRISPMGMASPPTSYS